MNKNEKNNEVLYWNNKINVINIKDSFGIWKENDLELQMSEKIKKVFENDVSL